MFKPSWWNVGIFILSPILIVIGQLKHVDPGVVNGTIDFLDQQLWDIIGGVWGLLGGGLASVRAIIEGWKRGLSGAGESVYTYYKERFAE